MLLALAGATDAAAAPPAAALDPSFGQDGRAYVSLPLSTDDELKPAAAVGPDGSVFLAKKTTVRRLTPSGQVDEAFGQEGTAAVGAPEGDSFEIEGLAVDSQGRLVIAGTSFHESERRPFTSIYGFETSEFTPTAARIIRLLPDGRPDPGFGEGGAVETEFGLPAPPAQEGEPGPPKAEVTVTGVAIGAGDAIVITGGSVTGEHYGCQGTLRHRLTYAAYVARLSADGRPDTGFGGGDGVFGGRNVAENPLHIGIATEPAIGPGESITYGSGFVRCPSEHPPATPGLARLTASGEWQPGFGRQNGIRGEFWQSAIGAEGSIAAVGLKRWRPGEAMHVRAFRAGPSGRPDQSFGKDGTSEVTLRGPAWTVGATVAVDGSGRVLLADSQTKGAWHGFGLFRLRPDGSLERSFGRGGRLAFAVPELSGPAKLLLDPQGRAVVVTEYRGEARGEGLAVTRLTFSR